MASLQYLGQGTQTLFSGLVYEHADKAESTVVNNPEVASLAAPLLAIHKTCKYFSTNYF